MAASWQSIRRHRRAILIAFLLVFAIVTVWTVCQKTVYRSQGLLEIARENPSIVTAQDLFTVDSVSDAYLETQYKILKTDTLAERVIEELGLDHVKEFNPPKSSWWKMTGQTKSRLSGPGLRAGGKDPVAHQNTLSLFQSRLEISPVKRSRLIEISFESEDPVLAARVVNTLSADYIAQNMRTRSEAARKASEWLSRRLADVKVKLGESESALHEYASRNNLLFRDKRRKQ